MLSRPVEKACVLGTIARVAFALARRARASRRASAGTHLAAEAMVMEEAILLTGESSECCDGR
jgi:hypothetical protein